MVEVWLPMLGIDLETLDREVRSKCPKGFFLVVEHLG